MQALTPQALTLATSALEEHSETGLGVMEGLILWAGFLGAWLLVAGPLHQARVELTEEELEQERYVAAFEQAGPAPRTSIWWWLVPPLRLYLSHRRKERWQREVWMQLPHEDFEALANFMTKARGWVLVGAGGSLIAVKETWELVEGYTWPTWLFWVLVVVMAVLSIGNTILGAAMQRGAIDAHAARPAATDTQP